jgi:hypothetical protein
MARASSLHHRPQHCAGTGATAAEDDARLVRASSLRHQSAVRWQWRGVSSSHGVDTHAVCTRERWLAISTRSHSGYCPVSITLPAGLGHPVYTWTDIVIPSARVRSLLLSMALKSTLLPGQHSSSSHAVSVCTGPPHRPLAWLVHLFHQHVKLGGEASIARLAINFALRTVLTHSVVHLVGNALRAMYSSGDRMWSRLMVQVVKERQPVGVTLVYVARTNATRFLPD